MIITDSEISVVIPIYNEEDNLPLLIAKLQEVLSSLSKSWEIIFVDDGSHDQSYNLLCDYQKNNPNIRILKLSRNFGHQAALSAGLEASSGQAVITMDADLQHPPDLIPQMVKLWQQGYDVVQTIRQNDADIAGLKQYSSKIFYRLFNAFSEIDIFESGADFRLLSRRALCQLLKMPERNRFLRGMTQWIGFPHVALRYIAPPRKRGQSKYTFHKMIRLASDGLMSFSVAPLRIGLLFGLIAIFLALLEAGYVFVAKYVLHSVQRGWSSLMIVILFLGGVQLFSIGIIGEYIGKIYLEVKQRPLFIVEDSIGFQSISQNESEERFG
ncbi:glycosyltransferase family 2 protein [Sulfobacillus thermosulfidooxidans]|uniref:glycosyltransferase family 2 protein n=1 Tax=Sulfobacillus thermosulfidooxidans TaxID=28034 RepID=UPI00056A3866|nr:glycosyltransferase family 2 protein [Sulfobacillus thermosulfidooxidans]